MSKHWTLIYSGTEKTLANWGLQNLVRKLVSQAPDEITFDTPGKAFDAAPLFTYGATVEIWQDRTETRNADGTFSYSGGSRWFTGRRTLNPRRGYARVEDHRYLFSGPWIYLEEHLFQQKWNIYTDPANPANSLVGGFRSHVILNQGDNGSALTTAQQITAAVDYARIECLAPVQVDSNLPAFSVPFDEQREITCADVIRKQLRWIPDAVTWWDYAATPNPKLYVKQRSSLTAVALDLAAAAKGIVTAPWVESVDISRRDDLLRPAVVLKFEKTNEINGAAWLTVTEQAAPAGATGKEFGAVVATIQLQGFSISVASATLTTADIKADDTVDQTGNTRLNWWKTRIPWLASDRIDNLSIPAATVVRETARPRELTEGQVAPWMNFIAATETIKAKATFRVKDSAGNVVGEEVEKEIDIRLISTDANQLYDTELNGVRTKTYYSVSSFVSGEAIPSGLADALYAAVNAVQYDGQITVAEDEIRGLVSLGNVLNLSNGHADWGNMRALIQQVVEDVDHGRTTIIFGPAKHLGLEDLVELLRVNSRRFVYTSPSSRTSGQGNSGQLALGKQTPKENSGAGGGKFKKLVVSDLANWGLDIDANVGKRNVTMIEGNYTTVWGSNYFQMSSPTVVLSFDITNGAFSIVSGNPAFGFSLSLLGLTKMLQISQVEYKDENGASKKRLFLCSPEESA